MLLEIALIGLGGALLAGSWDLGRRQLAVRSAQPDPAEVEHFEVQKLHELEGRIFVVEHSLEAVADQAVHELGKARNERISARASESGKKGGSAPRAVVGDQPPVTEEEQLAQVSENLNLRPPAGA